MSEKQVIFTVKDPVTNADLSFDLTKILYIVLPSYLSLQAGQKNANVATITVGAFAVQCPHSVGEKVRRAWWEYHGYEQPNVPVLINPGNVLSN